MQRDTWRLTLSRAGTLPEPTELDLVKLQWLLPPNSSDGHGDGDDDDNGTGVGKSQESRYMLSEVRFGWEGDIISADVSPVGHSPAPAACPPADGLHNHAEHPDLAGYTLSELLHLSMSAVMSQRVLPLRALSNIAAKCRLASNRQGPRLLLFMSISGACACASSGMLSESVSVAAAACALAGNLVYSTAVICNRNGRPACAHVLWHQASLCASPLLVAPQWSESAAAAFDTLQLQETLVRQQVDVLQLDPCTQLMVQGFAHHAAALLKRFTSRDSNMPTSAAANVMLIMRVLACTSSDYCTEFISSGAIQHVMHITVSYSGRTTSTCKFDWATMDDDSDTDVAVAALRLLDIMCKASRATASLVCGTGVLDSCMRWFFVLPLEQESPILQSLLLLWHTCCCYGIATNAFADVADKLNIIFHARHHARQVSLLCCAYMRCAGLERASADGVQVAALVGQLLRAGDVGSESDHACSDSSVSSLCLEMLAAAQQLASSSSSSSSASAAALAQVCSEAVVRKHFDLVLASVDAARVLGTASAFFSTPSVHQLTAESLSLSRDLAILEALFTCRRLFPWLGLGDRVPACALVRALQAAGSRSLALRSIPSLKRTVVKGACLPPLYSIAVRALVSGLACHSLSIPTIPHPACVLGIFCSGTLDSLCLFERVVTSVNWKGACGLRSTAASSVALWRAVFDEGESRQAVGDDDSLMISAAVAVMKAGGEGQVENWQHEPAGVRV